MIGKTVDYYAGITTFFPTSLTFKIVPLISIRICHIKKGQASSTCPILFEYELSNIPERLVRRLPHRLNIRFRVKIQRSGRV